MPSRPETLNFHPALDSRLPQYFPDLPRLFPSSHFAELRLPVYSCGRSPSSVSSSSVSESTSNLLEAQSVLEARMLHG